MTITIEAFEAAADTPMTAWSHQCHAASLALVRSGLIGKARVARGAAKGVGGQHSWVTLGDPYDPDAKILDPTIWSYTGDEPYIRETTCRIGRYTPHGSGRFWDYRPPKTHGGDTITIGAPVEWSTAARPFLNLLGPLDLRGWMELLHRPVGGWPAKEIISAAYGDSRLSALIPVDIVGMITDHNPHGLYW